MSISRKKDRHGRPRFYVTVELPRDAVTGERRRQSLGGFPSKKEARAAEAKAREAVGEGRTAVASKVTVADFLRNEWLPALRISKLRPSTLASYEQIIRTRVLPTIGGYRLRDLRQGHLEELYVDLLKSGRRDGSGLSPRTVQLVHVTIRKALQAAVRRGYLLRNVANDVELPWRQEGDDHRAPDLHVWTASELRHFLSHVSSDRLYALYLLGGTTGMRRGELLGLRWEDVDLAAARVQVRQTLVDINYKPVFSEPKTKKSRRSISLDPATVAALREHRKRQIGERLEWGPAYEESGLVFTRENGSLIHPQSVSLAFEKLGRAADLPRIRFHDLRHTYATIALGAGEHPKVVSERLGHSSVVMTLDVYSHVIPALGEEAAVRVASVILG